MNMKASIICNPIIPSKNASLSIRFSFEENYKKIRYTFNTLSYEEIQKNSSHTRFSTKTRF